MDAHANDYADATRTVRTSVGDLYVGGFPTDETVRRAYDQLDLQRATQVHLELMPWVGLTFNTCYRDAEGEFLRG